MQSGEIESQLADFCIKQRSAFKPNEWYSRYEANGQAVAFVAKYLSATSWYGYEDDLDRIASTMHMEVRETANLFREAQAIDFDLMQFVVKVRTGINLRRKDQTTPEAQPRTK
jgi:hypothetical protein